MEILDSLSFVHTPLYKSKEFLQQKYIVEGLSLAQISDQIVSSKEAVRRGLYRFKIPIREPHFTHGRPSQLRFGKKLKKGRQENHLPEQNVINVARSLKAQGLGLREIARTLTKLGIPTKCRGKGWHPQMVSRIL